MKTLHKLPRLLLVGLGARLIVAVLLSMGLWAGFLWAIRMPVAL